MRTENAKHEWIAEVDAKSNADLLAEVATLRAERDRFEREAGELRGRVEALESVTRTTVRKAVSTVEVERDAALAQVAAMRIEAEARVAREQKATKEAVQAAAQAHEYIARLLPAPILMVGISPEEHDRQLREVAEKVRAACADKARDIHATRGGIFDHQYMRENHADAIVRALDITSIIDEVKGKK